MLNLLNSPFPSKWEGSRLGMNLGPWCWTKYPKLMWIRRVVSHSLWTQDVWVSKGCLTKMKVFVVELPQDFLGQFLNGMMSIFWEGICLIMWTLENYRPFSTCDIHWWNDSLPLPHPSLSHRFNKLNYPSHFQTSQLNSL